MDYTHQFYGFAANGELNWASPKKLSILAAWVIRRIFRKRHWYRAEWARKYPDMEPGKPMAFVCVEPYDGGPKRWFDAEGSELKGDPR